MDFSGLVVKPRLVNNQRRYRIVTKDGKVARFKSKKPVDRGGYVFAGRARTRLQELTTTA